MSRNQNSFSRLTGMHNDCYRIFRPIYNSGNCGDVMRKPSYRKTIAGLLACSIALSPFASQVAFADQNIGDAQVVVNDVKGTVGKSDPAPLRAGIDVFENEVIRTAGNSASRVLFQDNTNLAVGANSEVTLDHFVFDPDPQKSAVALSIAKGVVRFTTGNLPKSAYKITTPTATIGVRGTIITISVLSDGTTVVSVDEGTAVVNSDGTTVTVNAGMTTTVVPGTPPTPPGPTPPAPPVPVSQMDYLLADTALKAGGAAGGASAGLLSTPLLAAGIGAAFVAGVIVVTVSGHSHGTSSTTSTGK